MKETRPLEFRGGTAGAVGPVALFIFGVIALALQGAPDERGFWPVLLAALALGLALARDRHRYAEAALAGMSQPLVLLMVMAWMLAGVLGTLMNASGFIDALVWTAEAASLSGGAWAAAAFVICCLVSTSTGTSLGTVILCAPLLYPAGAALGASAPVLLGAILGGATFGDNISPVSDTTIASATTQGAEIGAVVRSRLKYALPAAAVALVLYALVGSTAETAAGAPSSALHLVAEPGTAPASPRALPMLAVPALVIALLLARRHLLEGLLFGAAAAAGLGLVLGLLAPSQILFIDPERFAARGLVVDGVERSLGVAVFTLLLTGLVAGFEASGIMQRLLALAERRAETPRGAETWMFATISAAVLLTTHSVVALLAVGPFARRAGERLGLDANRRANLLDITVCTYPFLLPHCIPTILAASTTVSGAAAGMPRLSALAAGLYNFHSWALLAVVILAIATGYGRNRGHRSRRGRDLPLG